MGIHPRGFLTTGEILDIIKLDSWDVSSPTNPKSTLKGPGSDSLLPGPLFEKVYVSIPNRDLGCDPSVWILVSIPDRDLERSELGGRRSRPPSPNYPYQRFASNSTCHPRSATSNRAVPGTHTLP